MQDVHIKLPKVVFKIFDELKRKNQGNSYQELIEKSCRYMLKHKYGIKVPENWPYYQEIPNPKMSIKKPQKKQKHVTTQEKVTIRNQINSPKEDSLEEQWYYFDRQVKDLLRDEDYEGLEKFLNLRRPSKFKERYSEDIEKLKVIVSENKHIYC